MNFSTFSHTVKSADQPIEASDVERMLLNVNVTEEELAPYLIWNETRYSRNLVTQTEHCALYVMTWLPGQFTAIHDHRGSTCGVRVLSGTMTEITYHRAPNSCLYPVGSSALHAGELSVTMDEDVHQVGNLEKDIGLVTLHLYTPPMGRGMKYYDTYDTWINGYDQLIASSIKPTVISEPVQTAAA